MAWRRLEYNRRAGRPIIIDADFSHRAEQTTLSANSYILSPAWEGMHTMKLAGPNSLSSRAFALLPRGIRGRLFLLISAVLLPVMLLLGWINYQRYETRRAS